MRQRAIAKTAYGQTRRDRKKVEMLFADLVAERLHLAAPMVR
jgi:hypothetical protein